MDNRLLVIFLMFFSSFSYAADSNYGDYYWHINDLYGISAPAMAAQAVELYGSSKHCQSKDHWGSEVTTTYVVVHMDTVGDCENRGHYNYLNIVREQCPNESPNFDSSTGSCIDLCPAGQTQRLYGSYLNSSASSVSDCGVPQIVTTPDNCEWNPDVQGGWQVALNGSMCEWWSDATSLGQSGDHSSGYTAQSAGGGPPEPSSGGDDGSDDDVGDDAGSDIGDDNDNGTGDSGDGSGGDTGGDTGNADGTDTGSGDSGSNGSGDSGSGSSGSGSGGDTGGSSGDDTGGSSGGDTGGDTADDGDTGGDTGGGDSDSGDSGSGGNGTGNPDGNGGSDSGESGDGDGENGNGGSGGSGECIPGSNSEDCGDEPSGECDPLTEECCDPNAEECGDGGELDYRNCAADFVCDGDALQCAQLEVEHASLCLMSDSEYQDFLNSSEIKGDGTQISETGVLNALDGGTVDISDALNLSDIFNVSSSASCPEFPTVETSYGSYNVDTADNFCQYANTVRPFVIYMVSFFASLLVLRGITS